ncbi:MAG: hypothetical protein M1833_000153 [Piccolia ochrophora]|nr:MAG: hypothetical protein M1833_000153 [Piccolia ochrophora]
MAYARFAFFASLLGSLPLTLLASPVDPPVGTPAPVGTPVASWPKKDDNPPRPIDLYCSLKFPNQADLKPMDSSLVPAEGTQKYCVDVANVTCPGVQWQELGIRTAPELARQSVASQPPLDDDEKYLLANETLDAQVDTLYTCDSFCGCTFGDATPEEQKIILDAIYGRAKAATMERAGELGPEHPEGQARYSMRTSNRRLHYWSYRVYERNSRTGRQQVDPPSIF